MSGHSGGSGGRGLIVVVILELLLKVWKRGCKYMTQERKLDKMGVELDMRRCF